MTVQDDDASDGTGSQSTADRRTVLAAAGGLPLAPGVARALAADPPRAVGTGDLTRGDPAGSGDADLSVFPQGVASGDPTPSGAVVWTRVAPDAYRSAEPLRLTVAADEAFEQPVGSWRVPADAFGPDRDHTAKVDLADGAAVGPGVSPESGSSDDRPGGGELAPDATYHYRFAYDGATSPVGRTRTLPAPDASPDSVRFGVFTCQDYRNGFYNAYRCALADDLDFLVHLGDFVYEGAGGSAYPGRGIELPSGERVAMGLADFRHLHRTYRSDDALRAALAAHPLLATWDDHEIVNDRYFDYEEGRPYAGPGDHPRNDDGAFMTRLFADGIRAWWEYTPARVRYDPDADLLDSLALYRAFRFGDLVDLVVTDERLYRSEPPAGLPGAPVSVDVDGDDGSGRTILGREQREWFTERVARDDATWTAWANEVLLSGLTVQRGDRDVFNYDAWDGYAAERRELAGALADAPNLVALTGDLHTAMAARVESEAGDRLGVELMTPAVTSPNLKETLDLPDWEGAAEVVEELVRETNPHVAFFDSHHWGYAVVEFTPDDATYTAYAVDKESPAESPDRRVLGSYRVPAGEVRLTRR